MSKEAKARIVFVYGALRSGTTAFRLMLDAHPQTVNPGEFDFLFDYLSRDPAHPTGWRVNVPALTHDRIFRDKNLQLPTGPRALDGLDLIEFFFEQIRGNTPAATVITLNVHRNAARIVEAFPDARFIHMVRDPRDVARSSIPMGWAAHVYYGVDHWIETERDWEAVSTLIPPESQFFLRYEALFSAWESELKRVCDFLGITWSTAMLSYHEHTSYAAPDPSLIEQWRHKCTMADVALVEGKAGAMMAARGYATATTPHHPTLRQRMQLAIAQKLYLWRFGTRQFGARLFWGEKIARHLRLKRRHSLLVTRMAAIHKNSLK